MPVEARVSNDFSGSAATVFSACNFGVLDSFIGGVIKLNNLFFITCDISPWIASIVFLHLQQTHSSHSDSG